ncbi:MAG TPA: hemerythrin domain-containing protein, partial [Polyangiaceae bacterium]|nr:hemerythrin domain-containing protein [Polyangiaceae bacterium]
MPWHPSFSTDLPDLDAQHQYFVMLLDRLDVACQLDNGIQLELGLVELRRYAAYHFACEESLMDGYGFAGEAHRAAHRTIIARLDEILADPSTDHSKICLFVFEWLTAHIQRDDFELARHVLSRRKKVLRAMDDLSEVG